jgi:hypothetical protein
MHTLESAPRHGGAKSGARSSSALARCSHRRISPRSAALCRGRPRPSTFRALAAVFTISAILLCATSSATVGPKIWVGLVGLAGETITATAVSFIASPCGVDFFLDDDGTYLGRVDTPFVQGSLWGTLHIPPGLPIGTHQIIAQGLTVAADGTCASSGETAQAAYTITPSRPSTEADVGQDCCLLPVGPAFFDEPYEWGRLFPEWEAVDREDPTHQQGGTSVAVLEGVVTGPSTPDDIDSGPHVSFEDNPFSHMTHDLTFDVRPDPGFEHLLGTQVFGRCATSGTPCTVFANGGSGCPLGDQRCPPLGPGIPDDCVVDGISQQPQIEVEWESGLGASNGINFCSSTNNNGQSCGFFSYGHRRRAPIWNWPTIGDRVHIEGYWVWDRGHPPAKTEIHPPRLMATTRRLPSLGPYAREASGTLASGLGNDFVLSTRTDIFASGDGGALWNNRGGISFGGGEFSAARHTPMDDRDYAFQVRHLLPAPGPSAVLNWQWIIQDGDTYRYFGNAKITRLPGQPDTVTVEIPWKSQGVRDDAFFARTLHLFWTTGTGICDSGALECPPTPSDRQEHHGVASRYRPRVFVVTAGDLHINPYFLDGLDENHRPRAMQYRVFFEAAGTWLFLNELVGDDRILTDGIGSTGPGPWGIRDRRYSGDPHWQMYAIVPPNGEFRIHAGGWEADGANNGLGAIYDPAADCTDTPYAVIDFLNEYITNITNGLQGCKDDPIGEVNMRFNCAAQPGVFDSSSRGRIWDQEQDITLICGGIVDRTRPFRVTYTLEELPWPGKEPMLGRDVCDGSSPRMALYLGAPTYPLGFSDLLGRGDDPFITSSTMLSLRAVDDPSGGVLSVQYRMYRDVDPAPFFRKIMDQTVDFSLSGADGRYVVEVQATDYAQNTSLANHAVHLDNSPPTITIAMPPEAEYLQTGSVVVDVAVEDGAGAGVDAVSLVLDGGGSLAMGTTLDLLTEVSLGEHVIVVTASDKLGHEARSTVTFRVKATADSIMDAVERFALEGAIDGLGESLLAKLGAAARAQGRRQCKPARRAYEAFIAQVFAQANKHITAQAARILIESAVYVSDRC